MADVAVQPPTKRRKLDKKPVIQDRFKSKRNAKGKAAQREPSLPAPTTTTPPATQGAETPTESAARRHNCCDSPNVAPDDDGNMVCNNCFTQISDANIVAEITFEETSKGAATVQGDFIGENARHASTLGRGAAQRVGGIEKNTIQDAERKGRERLRALCPQLGILDATMNQAIQLYMLATNPNFNFAAGRQTNEVVAACLYAVCRRQKDNLVMLVDIAELQHQNVFRLGEVYKDLCRELYIGDDPTAKAVGSQPIVDVESLVMKYCRKLQFDNATRAVAEDAVRIIRRMKRDWMVTGRHPSGLCGAAIILAARMNNFRRSVREVVLVSKVADITIMKRVAEFRNSKAAAMTVSQFREFGERFKPVNDPPILYESEVMKMKFEEKKRKREESRETRERTENGTTSETPANLDDSTAESDDPNGARRKRQRTSETQSATPAATQQEPRRDADGFLIPALPTENTQAGNEEPTDGRKRKRKTKKDPPPPVVITEEELITEQKLMEEIEYVLHDGEIEEKMTELEKIKVEEHAAKVAELQKKDAAEKNKARRESEGISWFEKTIPTETEDADITPEDLEKEFADDPEVLHCLLTPEEQRNKEKIWLYNNEDWMRQQQEKKMIEEVAKATGRNDKGKKPGKVTKKKRKGKMGDGTTLRNATTPIESAKDAVEEMVNARVKSSFINEEALNALFRRSPSVTSGSSPANNSSPSSAEAGAQSGERQTGDSSSSTSSPDPAAENFEDELDYGSDDGSPQNDRDEDEEDYQRAVSPTGGWAGLGGEEDFGDDQEY